MSNEDERKLFVAGLPDSMSEDVLRQLFEATGGTVVNVTLPKHRDTGRPRGFGFVTMSSGAEAVSARSALDGSLQAGRSISVRPFSSDPPKRDATTGSSGVASSGGNTGDRTLYVGNLPYDCTQQELETLFNEKGVTPVVRIHLPVGPDGRMRGFGFVTMGSAEAANAAIVGLRGVEMRGRGLMVNIAHPRGERPAGGGGGGGGYSGPPPSRRDSFGGGGGGYAPDFPPPAPPDDGRDRRNNDWDRPEGGGPAAKGKKGKKKRGRSDDDSRRGATSRDWKERDWDDD
jgi:RNA recognition motif-containing protein